MYATSFRSARAHTYQQNAEELLCIFEVAVRDLNEKLHFLELRVAIPSVIDGSQKSEISESSLADSFIHSVMAFTKTHEWCVNGYQYDLLEEQNRIFLERLNSSEISEYKKFINSDNFYPRKTEITLKKDVVFNNGKKIIKRKLGFRQREKENMFSIHEISCEIPEYEKLSMSNILLLENISNITAICHLLKLGYKLDKSIHQSVYGLSDIEFNIAECRKLLSQKNVTVIVDDTPIP